MIIPFHLMRIRTKRLPKQATIANSKIQIANIILALLFFASMGLAIWGINIYRLTIVPFRYLFQIVAISTLVTLPVILFVLKPTYNFFWIFLTSTAIGGGTSYFVFLYINSIYSNAEISKQDFSIVKTGTLAKGKSSSCGSPFVVVDFNGVEKELIFFCEYEKIIKSFSKVRLEYSEGFFGFEIIKSKTLLK